EAADTLTGDARGDVSDALEGPDARHGPGATDSPGSADGDPGETHLPSSVKEKKAMTGIDLGGDDLKNVSFWIRFTKTHFVATLQDMQNETIDYATDEASYGGLKIGGFFQALANREVLWPEVWNLTPPGRDYEELKEEDEETGVTYLTGIPLRD